MKTLSMHTPRRTGIPLAHTGNVPRRNGSWRMEFTVALSKNPRAPNVTAAAAGVPILVVTYSQLVLKAVTCFKSASQR